MRIRSIDLDDNGLPEAVTVTMTIAEAAVVGHLVGNVVPDQQPDLVAEHMDGVYSGMVGGLFNRFWDEGLDGYLAGDTE